MRFHGATEPTPRAALTAPSAMASLQDALVVESTDFVSAGVGGMRDVGQGTITVEGVSGTVTQALLVWHGPSTSWDPEVDAEVQLDGTTVIGTNVGTSSSNCWGYTNSHAYSADVTALVTTNGSYLLDGFGSAPRNVPNASNTNGASLLVFFDDGNPSNDRDITVLVGNDSNYFDAPDPEGWQATATGIEHVGGDASLQLHVADGQAFPDGAVVVDGEVVAAEGAIFEGDSVPSDNDGPAGNGSLWDIVSFDLGVALEEGTNDLQLTSELANDCLSLVAMVVDVPAEAPASCRADDSDACNDYIAQAESISDRAWNGGETAFTRDEYLALFEAAECKTGVPATVLKAIAFSEALGVYYEDAYPRQFIEPCDGDWNLNNWGHTELWSRYYGHGWPVLAVDAPDTYHCIDPDDDASVPPQAGYPDFSFQLGGNLVGYANVCSNNPNSGACIDVCPGDPTCAPPDVAMGDDWAEIWPSVIHTTTGSDAAAGYGDSYGLGIMALTYPVGILVCDPNADSGEGRLTLVGECHVPVPGDECPDIYPLDGYDPAIPFDMEPLAGLERVARDPYFNILQAAQLMLVKYQKLYHEPSDPAFDELVQQVDCGDEGHLLMVGPDAAPPEQYGQWAEAGGRYKTSPTCVDRCARKKASATCQAQGASCEECCVAEDIMGAIEIDLAANATSNCFCDSPYRPNTLASGTQCSIFLKAEFVQMEPGDVRIQRSPAECVNHPQALVCPFDD